MDSILDGLNAAQKAAVTSPANVIQILAPPGSGKTKTLTSRVAYLLRHHAYKPWNIICLTFTIKSSKEMRERIAKLLGDGIERRLVLGTFHSVCRRYLVAYGYLIGIAKSFGIADTSDSLSIIKRVIKRHGISLDAKKAQSRISNSKSKGIGYEQLEQEQVKRKDVDEQEFVTIYRLYEKQLARSNLLDYDDLLLRCVDLLHSHPSCVSNVEAVLIDEFQDTNTVQFELMRLFASQHKRVTTVGDPDQSIYGWRSAEIKNLRKMQRQFPDTLVIHLEENYRSSGAILLSAQEIIEQDEARPQKALMPTHCPGTAPVLRRLPSADIEAAWVVSEIRRFMALTGNMIGFSDIAVLLRSASLSRLLETAMGRSGIPYKMVGGHRFYDRIEIKVLLDYLRVISQPNNNDAVSRVINVPTRGIGQDTVKRFLEHAEMEGISLWQLIKDLAQGNAKIAIKVSKSALTGLASFMNIILVAHRKLSETSKVTSPEDLIRYVVKKLDFQAYLERSHSEDHETRWANVEELVAQAAEFVPLESVFSDEDQTAEDQLPEIENVYQETSTGAEEALSKFLANVALSTELQREEDTDDDAKPQSQVTISTIHAAKGLEWPVVFVPSAYDGCIPHSRAEDTDEERRLLYVAMTRAQALLYLSCPLKNSQREEATLSPFLSDRKVQRLLTNQGPAINSSEVVDIARILGRKCPFQQDINIASAELESREDNLWPLDGTEHADAVQKRWTTFEQSGAGYAGRKRKRPDGEAGQWQSVARASVSITGVTTTMTQASAFSCPGIAGFTTAAEQLLQIKETQAQQREEEQTRAKKVRTKPPSKSTGSLLDMWGAKSKTADSALVNVRIPLKPIQQAVHFDTSSRKYPPSTDDPGTVKDKETPAFILLSSSPPRETSKPEPIPEPQHEAEPPQTSTKSSLTRFLPAQTFHETSMAQVQSKRTLGMRRSLQGWDNRARQKPGMFSAPRPLHGDMKSQ